MDKGSDNNKTEIISLNSEGDEAPDVLISFQKAKNKKIKELEALMGDYVKGALNKDILISTQSQDNTDTGVLESCGFLELTEIDSFYMESLALFEEVQIFSSHLEVDDLLFLKKFDDYLKVELQEKMLNGDALSYKDRVLLIRFSDFSQIQEEITKFNVLDVVKKIRRLMPEIVK